MRIILVILVALTASCGGSEPNPSPSPSPSPSPIAAPTEVTGLITEVTYEGEQMTSFVVESVEGPLEILIDPAHDYGFNLKHLEKHRSEKLPVWVTLESRDDGLYAVDIQDA